MKNILMGFPLIALIFLNAPEVIHHNSHEYAFQIFINIKNNIHPHQNEEYFEDLINVSSINYGDPIGAEWLFPEELLIDFNNSFGIRFF